ncbi:phasin family protein [Tateyamaria pelophila]|uniref:phasin family protein n=1 Tax=Tateyamaria pelophila TaxID=328415 RepID=UPI001CBC799E|nr:phasin family protein [Tateyamaria pelophila]
MAKHKAPSLDPTASMTSAMVTFGPTMTKAWFGLASECAQFAVNRLQQDLEAQRSLLSCKTPIDLVQRQFDYCQAVSQLCANQSTRMFELMTETVQQTSDEAKRDHSRKYDDIPL